MEIIEKILTDFIGFLFFKLYQEIHLIHVKKKRKKTCFLACQVNMNDVFVYLKKIVFIL